MKKFYKISCCQHKTHNNLKKMVKTQASKVIDYYLLPFFIYAGEVTIKGRGNSRVYPNPKDGSKNYPLRSMIQHERDVFEVQRVDNIVK